MSDVIKLNLKLIYKVGKWSISIGSILFIFFKLKSISLSELDLLLQTIQEKSNLPMLFLVLLLMILNWFIEALKWKIVLSNLQTLSIQSSFKSVLAGVSFGIVTPNRIGEMVGRIIYIDEDKKISASLLNIICSVLQLAVTFLFGGIALLLFKENWLLKIPYTSIISIIALFLLALFGVLFFIAKTPIIKLKLTEFILPFKEISFSKLSVLFSLSIFRYAVFTVQYMLVLSLFQIELTVLESIICISLNFFLVTIIPTYALVEIGIRGTVAIAVFSVYGISALPVVSASLLVWIINLAIPAIFGTIILVKE